MALNRSNITEHQNYSTMVINRNQLTTPILKLLGLDEERLMVNGIKRWVNEKSLIDVDDLWGDRVTISPLENERPWTGRQNDSIWPIIICVTKSNTKSLVT